MLVSDIKLQARDKNRASIYVDGKYSFSLSIEQLQQFKIKIGNVYQPNDINHFKRESKIGKAYLNAVFYCLMRPRSEKEVRDYLFKKTLLRINKFGKRESVIDASEAETIFEKLIANGYIDNSKFAEYWLENRFTKKGISKRKLISELKSKGLDDSLISLQIAKNFRDDKTEIKKIISRKRNIYTPEKMFAYLMGQGFNYDDVKAELGLD